MVTLSSGYHPQSNGQTEHTNQSVESALQCVTARHGKGLELRVAMGGAGLQFPSVSIYWGVALHGIVGLSTAAL